MLQAFLLINLNISLKRRERSIELTLATQDGFKASQNETVNFRVILDEMHNIDKRLTFLD